MIANPCPPAHDGWLWKAHAFVIKFGRLEPIALMSLLALGACVQSAAPNVSGDGDYRGSSTRFQVLLRTCPRPGLLTLSVRGGVMYYLWGGQYIPVSVLSNGTLSGTLPGVQLTGTHDGTTMQGDVTDGQCGLHFTVKKVGS